MCAHAGTRARTGETVPRVFCVKGGWLKAFVLVSCIQQKRIDLFNRPVQAERQTGSVCSLLSDGEKRVDKQNKNSYTKYIRKQKGLFPRKFSRTLFQIFEN